MNPLPQLNSRNFQITTDYVVYACAFAQCKQDTYRIALGSFIEEEQNLIVIAKADSSKGIFECQAAAHLKYSPSKLKFIYCDSTEYLLSSGDVMRVWRPDEFRRTLVCERELFPQSGLAGPVISFDLNRDNLLACAQMDRTCTIWDLKRWDEAVHQFFAHSEETTDVAFTSDDNVFLTVGGEGTCRLHDLRQKDRMNLIYDNKTRLLKLACSSEGLVALLSDGKCSIQVVDLKKPGQLLMELKEHKEFVTQVMWANSKNLLSTADDGFCLIWDLSIANKYTTRQAIAIPEEITNLCMQPQTNIVGCSFRNNFKIYDFN